MVHRRHCMLGDAPHGRSTQTPVMDIRAGTIPIPFLVAFRQSSELSAGREWWHTSLDQVATIRYTREGDK